MGFIKKNGRGKGETKAAENTEYSFPEDTELKECRYCQVMIPKKAKICPNCRKRLKKNWLGFFCLLCVLAACGAGVYYYFAVYSVTEQVSADTAAIQSEEAIPDAEDGLTAEDAAGTPGAEADTAKTADTETDSAVQIENLPEVPADLEGLGIFVTENNGSSGEQNVGHGAENADEFKEGAEAGKEAGLEEKTEAGKTDDLKAEAETVKADDPEEESEAEKEEDSEEGDEAEKGDDFEEESEVDKADDPKKKSEIEKIEEENAAERRTQNGNLTEEEDRAGMAADADSEEETKSDAETAEVTDFQDLTEEEFRDICQRVDYKKLLRRQDIYLNAAVTEELTVMEQVDGGLFDENIYYLCKREDEQGITRYYIIRDDREEDMLPILEGDVLRVYGQLFGSCKLPGYLVKTQPTVPALTMVYYDLMEE